MARVWMLVHVNAVIGLHFLAETFLEINLLVRDRTFIVNVANGKSRAISAGGVPINVRRLHLRRI